MGNLGELRGLEFGELSMNEKAVERMIIASGEVGGSPEPSSSSSPLGYSILKSQILLYRSCQK